MKKIILINATHSEEIRVAVVEIPSHMLLDLLVERQSYKTKTHNIYMATITAIEPSLDACFVDYGSERHGFLPFREIAPNYLLGDSNSQSVKHAIRVGQEVIVQVEKDERGSKGAALTTFVTLAGCYSVLMARNTKASGISRRIEGKDRAELRTILNQLSTPKNMGVIVRTAGVGKPKEELEWDINNLVQKWENIQKAAISRSPPFLIQEESHVLTKVLKDHLRDDIGEILVDNSEVYELLKNYLANARPDFVERIKLYDKKTPIFIWYHIEQQIEEAHQREIKLRSGGSVVVDHTEALTAFDINSGQATKGKDIEQTALEINKEAAKVIAQQTRLRGVGGLIVIDFIDMLLAKNRVEVEKTLREAFKNDRARTQFGTISARFGLLEMSRQRGLPSLGDTTRSVCPRCEGRGSIRGVESLALSIVRLIGGHAMRPNTTQVHIQLPIEIATFIINEKRAILSAMETNHGVRIIIIPNPNLQTPHYRVKRLTEGDPQSIGLGDSSSEVGGASGTGVAASYRRLLSAEHKDISYDVANLNAGNAQGPVVKSLLTAPLVGKSKQKPDNWIKRILTQIFQSSDKKSVAVNADKQPAETKASALSKSAEKGVRTIAKDKDIDQKSRKTHVRAYTYTTKRSSGRSRSTHTRLQKGKMRAQKQLSEQQSTRVATAFQDTNSVRKSPQSPQHETLQGRKNLTQKEKESSSACQEAPRQDLASQSKRTPLPATQKTQALGSQKPADTDKLWVPHKVVGPEATLKSDNKSDHAEETQK